MSLRCSTYIDYEQLRERGPEGEAELVGAVSGVAAGGKYPGLEQSISAHRFPVLPKIVLYSSLASSESFLRT